VYIAYVLRLFVRLTVTVCISLFMQVVESVQLTCKPTQGSPMGVDPVTVVVNFEHLCDSVPCVCDTSDSELLWY
jgi:hypothetical protein